MPETKGEETIVCQIVTQLDRALGWVNDVQAKVGRIYPSESAQESPKERPEAIGLAQALLLLGDLREGLTGLHQHLDRIV